MTLRTYITLLSLLFVGLANAQYAEYIDSLEQELQLATHDTTRVQLMIKLADEIQDDDIWPVYNQQAYDLADSRIPTSSGRELYIFKEHKAYAISNMGYLLDDQGDALGAIEKYLESLKLHKEIDCKPGMAAAYNNVGLIMYSQGDLDEAMVYYEQSRLLKEELGDIQGLGYWYLNMGTAIRDQGLLDSSLSMLRTSYAYFEQIADMYGMANTSNAIGNIYSDNGLHDSAIVFLRIALDTYLEINDQDGIAWELNNIGNNFIGMRQLDSALYYCNEALDLAIEIGYPYLVESAANNLVIIHRALGNYEIALEMYELGDAMRDSMLDVDAQKEILKQQKEFEHEMNILAIEAEQEKRDAINQLIIYSVSGGLFLVLLFTGFLFQRFRVTRRQRNVIALQKEEVEQQKSIIEEKSIEITDSIRYAERIQHAMLPTDEELKTAFPDSMLMYRPKDIVSGDFYWHETIDGKEFFAVVDCTGHGVPGAMVSVIGYNGLNRCVHEYGLTEPAAILDKLAEMVATTLSKHNTEVKDGMDMALMRYDRASRTLIYAGANNDLWYTRDGRMEELLATKQPIGVFADRTAFTSHSVQLEKGDCAFLFSDGYADQFGGDKGKKYMTGKFRQLLLELSSGPMESAQKELVKAFDDWKGSLEQIDDVCVFGFRA